MKTIKVTKRNFNGSSKTPSPPPLQQMSAVYEELPVLKPIFPHASERVIENSRKLQLKESLPKIQPRSLSPQQESETSIQEMSPRKNPRVSINQIQLSGIYGRKSLKPQIPEIKRMSLLPRRPTRLLEDINYYDREIKAACSNIEKLYWSGPGKRKSNHLLVIHLESLGFLYEPYFGQHYQEEFDDEEVHRHLKIHFRSVRMDFENSFSEFYYVSNLLDQTNHLKKWYYLVLMVPENRDIYLKTAIEIQNYFDAVYAIDSKSHLVDFTQLVKDFEVQLIKKIVVLNTFDPNLVNLPQFPKKTRQSIEQIIIEYPVPEGISFHNFMVYCSFKNVAIKHQEILKIILRFANNSRLFQVET